jgi:hypothetical protein
LPEIMESGAPAAMTTTTTGQAEPVLWHNYWQHDETSADDATTGTGRRPVDSDKAGDLANSGKAGDPADSGKAGDPAGSGKAGDPAKEPTAKDHTASTHKDPTAPTPKVRASSSSRR